MKAAREAFETTWGTNVSAQRRGQLLYALAEAMEHDSDQLSKLEMLDSGKPLAWCKIDIEDSVACLKYYAGAADKIHGRVIEIDDASKSAIQRKEPVGWVHSTAGVQAHADDQGRCADRPVELPAPHDGLVSITPLLCQLTRQEDRPCSSNRLQYRLQTGGADPAVHLAVRRAL